MHKIKNNQIEFCYLCFHVFLILFHVWSFGITTWEIFSFGKLPFKGINNINDLVSFLDEFQEANNRLEKPGPISSDCYYKIIANCQEYDPCDRPTFSRLKKLTKFCVDNHQLYVSKSIKSKFEECNGIYRKIKKHFSRCSDSKESWNKENWSRKRSNISKKVPEKVVDEDFDSCMSQELNPSTESSQELYEVPK